ncbi:MAG: hypothetical protein A3B30_00615 [Candidatus Komeilibacteria bacterium RIFCSPLOWO2_01_FULL_52_15]|nr:MAG: hypothetical protein A3B30_00615 [Candidatus Komeilibacteria bacterium RIFCSPLOWO2_01_FULL_52_15]
MPLSKEGRKHAQKIAGWFVDKGITKIYSSSVVRCRETAEILSAALSVPIVFDVRLLEILTAIQGMDLDAYKKDRNLRFSKVGELGGERMRDVQVRMLDCFYDINRNEKGNVVICSHGDGLYFLYCALAGKDLSADVTKFIQDEYQKKGTVREITVEGDQYTPGPILFL